MSGSRRARGREPTQGSGLKRDLGVRGCAPARAAQLDAAEGPVVMLLGEGLGEDTERVWSLRPPAQGWVSRGGVSEQGQGPGSEAHVLSNSAYSAGPGAPPATSHRPGGKTTGSHPTGGRCRPPGCSRHRAAGSRDREVCQGPLRGLSVTSPRC